MLWRTSCARARTPKKIISPTSQAGPYVSPELNLLFAGKVIPMKVAKCTRRTALLILNTMELTRFQLSRGREMAPRRMTREEQNKNRNFSTSIERRQHRSNVGARSRNSITLQSSKCSFEKEHFQNSFISSRLSTTPRRKTRFRTSCDKFYINVTIEVTCRASK